MPFIKSKAGETPANIYYQDCGEGQPIVLIHGWPLSHRMWEYQINALTEAGYRCIAYDRRGFGDSDKPWTGYDYDTMSADLHQLIVELDLNDAVIAGFSMGGGEVARYFGRFGSDRVSKAMLISAVPPYLKKTADNPDGGLEQEDIDGFMQGVKDDRIAFLDDFGKQFVNFDELGGDRISEDLVHYNKTIASFASPKATQDCITAFVETDFRDDLEKIDVPVLIVHGDSDNVVPLEVSGQRSHEMIADSRLEVVEGAPHGLNYTHTDKLNKLMKEFLGS
jgi:peroxiredoxin